MDKENYLIAGNGVYEQAKELGIPVRVIETNGKELVVVKRTDLSLEDERRKLLALADNHASDTSEFDMDLVIENFSEEVLKDWEFSLDDIDLSDELPASTTKPNNVAEDLLFLLSPCPVNKRGGWQDRKRAWLSLGIKSRER